MFTKIYRAGLGEEPAELVKTVGKLGEMAISPDGKQLAFAGAVSLNDPLAQSLRLVENPHGVLQGRLAYGGELHPPLGPDEQRLAQLGFEGLDLVAHRGLGEP